MILIVLAAEGQQQEVRSKVVEFVFESIHQVPLGHRAESLDEVLALMNNVGFEAEDP